MSTNLTATSWVYVLVQHPGGLEQIVGLHDSTLDVQFIPAFLDKETAAVGAAHIAVMTGMEPQAIIYEDLLQHAAVGGFLVFILDAQGRVLDRKDPQHPKA